jgi:hypothetical protein
MGDEGSLNQRTWAVESDFPGIVGTGEVIGIGDFGGCVTGHSVCSIGLFGSFPGALGSVGGGCNGLWQGRFCAIGLPKSAPTLNTYACYTPAQVARCGIFTNTDRNRVADIPATPFA